MFGTIQSKIAIKIPHYNLAFIPVIDTNNVYVYNKTIKKMPLIKININFTLDLIVPRFV